MIYVIAPYSHRLKRIRDARALLVESYIKAYYQQSKTIPFSPVLYGRLFETLVGGDWESWEVFCRNSLHGAGQVIVLMLSNWDTSVGCAAEIKLAEELGLEINYITEDEVNELIATYGTV